MTDIKELLEKYSKDCKIAYANDKVYKDECVYSYDTSEGEDGLNVCLKTFIAVSKDYLQIHFNKAQSHLYLNIKTVRKEVKNDSVENEPEKKKPTKFGLGVDGGFDLNESQFTFEHSYSLYIYPENKYLGLPESESLFSDNLKKSIYSVIQAESITFKEELAAQVQAWDGEQRFISKHSSTLHQISNPHQIPPTGWKCENCDKKENLWLNLTDGKILCGRKQLDGSGGNNHAIEHYNQNKYPLAVKLGTITAQGKADVYSYDEDDMVEDSNLEVHLAHFGINVKNMQKTEKTMAELEIDLNQKFGEWDLIQEAGCKLIPIYGPGFTGMRNLGNSCYMNSIAQMIFSIEDFQNVYFNNNNYKQYFINSPVDPSSDFDVQMAKLAYGLLSGKYSKEPSSQQQSSSISIPKGIKPTSFKHLIGRGHVEFSTKKQQDAQEFFSYILNLIDRNAHEKQINPANCFKFQLEDRLECVEDKSVKYTKRDETCLSLPVAQEAATNLEQVNAYKKRKLETEKNGEKLDIEVVRPLIPLSECFKLFTSSELIADFYNSNTKSKGNALKVTKFATFPDYLLIQMRKFELSSDWTPIKLDVAIDVPDILDLNDLRSKGKQSNEIEIKDDNVNKNNEIVKETINENIVNQLMDMGFSFEGSQRAAYNTREVNDAEVAVNWAVLHMEDADFNTPFKLPSKQVKKESKVEVNEESIASIMSFGFTRAQAVKALKETNNNLERAADWIFSHSDEVMDTTDDTAVGSEMSSAATTVPNSQNKDGNGKYKLVSFVSHMGTNANVGHYVVHINKDGKWCIFNDQNVSISEHSHKELAYLYLYRRV